ncbi:MAG: FHA domain-containing protein [Planctomycetota bacterium]
MATLVALTEGKRIDYELKEGQNLIGRHPDCPIAITDRTVSGRHAVIHGEGGEFVLQDIGSSNGTFVNQRQIEGRVKLNHNDAIRFGDSHARFHDPADQPAATGGSSPATVVNVQAKPDLDAGQVKIDEAYTATITGEVARAGRFGVLDVNPEAKLKAVLEISNSLAGTLDLATLLPKILDSLFSIFKHADRGCILLKDERTGEMVPRAMRHRREDEDSSVRLSRTIVSKVLSEKAGILSADAATDDAFSESQSIADLKIRSMMCVPLLGLDGEALGILSIDSQNPLGQFTRDDLDILMTVAGQAALAYENARLVQAYADKQKQDAELDLARSVQRALLPTELPTAEGYQFYASYDAARAVGGDMILITTDGVEEAMNPEGDLYGTERVLELVKNGPPEAEELGKLLLADVRRHASGRPQSDDITIMTFGRNPPDA